jgi:hypothetical protein
VSEQFLLTDPSSQPAMPPRPRAPTTTRSACRDCSARSFAGCPSVATISTTIGGLPAIAFATTVCSACSAAEAPSWRSTALLTSTWGDAIGGGNAVQVVRAKSSAPCRPASTTAHRRARKLYSEPSTPATIRRIAVIPPRLERKYSGSCSASLATAVRLRCRSVSGARGLLISGFAASGPRPIVTASNTGITHSDV